MKSAICTWIGVAGAFLASALGGWDAPLGSLVVFMAVDFATGLLAAGAGKSPKTARGGISSAVIFTGLAKKTVILLLVLIGYRIDLVLGLGYVRNTVIIGFLANELISVVENAGLLGVPMPEVIKNVLEILKSKGGGENDGQG